MARKRASVKGKGADIFLSGQDDQQGRVGTPAARAHKKATFYLPPDLLDRLDDAWLDMRRVNRGVTKSELVAAALAAALAEYDKRGKQSRLHRAATGRTEPEES